MVTLISFIVSVVVTILSYMGNLIITGSVTLLDFLLVWQIFMVMLWLLNRMAHGTGSHGSIHTNDGGGGDK